MKILIVYYSRTGVTRSASEQIARLLNADREELQERTDRHGLWGFIKGGRDALLRRASDLHPVEHDPARYDLVIAGTPVWAGTLCPAVRTYLERWASAIRHAAIFCTHGGGGPSRSFMDAERLVGKPPVATLSLRDRAVKRGASGQDIAAFVGTLAAGGADGSTP